MRLADSAKRGTFANLQLPHLYRCQLYQNLCDQKDDRPAKGARYCGAMYVKLNAVTAGHNFREFMKLVGTVCLIRSHALTTVSPESIDCMPKK